MKNMTISMMSKIHIEAMSSIERVSFKNPWTELSFFNELSNDHSYNFVLTSKNKSEEKLIAYLCMRRIIDEIHILKMAVQSAYRRKGMAYYLLKNGLLQSAAKNQIRTAFLEVRPTNVSGLSLYQKLGFQIIGKRPRYYTDTGEDAIIMKKLL